MAYSRGKSHYNDVFQEPYVSIEIEPQWRILSITPNTVFHHTSAGGGRIVLGTLLRVKPEPHRKQFMAMC